MGQPENTGTGIQQAIQSERSAAALKKKQVGTQTRKQNVSGPKSLASSTIKKKAQKTESLRHEKEEEAKTRKSILGSASEQITNLWRETGKIGKRRTWKSGGHNYSSGYEGSH